MSVFPSEDRSRLRRLRSDKAIQLAMLSRWEEAADLNRQILELFPNDVDTHNRLGKALLELGRYDEARIAYQQAAKLDPSSTIAQKNLQRLAKLIEERGPELPPAQLDPRLFIEESGRTTQTNLVELGAPETLAKLTAGDQLKLEVVGHAVKVLDLADEVIGQVEPKLGQRLMRLFEMGNSYSAAVTGADEQNVRVIIRETHRDPSMGNRPTFPTTVSEAGRAYMRDILRYDVEDEDDESLDEPDTADRVEADATMEEPSEEPSVLDDEEA